MTIIVPAVLTKDLDDLEVKIRQVESITEIAQIDVMDGKFVPSTSINSEDLKQVVEKTKTKLFLEVHLMVSNPERYFQEYINAGAKRILFHYEAMESALYIERLLDKIKEQKIDCGLVINPKTPVEAVKPFFDKIGMLLLMAVNPGFYGAPFIPEVLDKAREISKMEKKFILSLDGGVKLDNFLEIKNAGVEQIDIGSGLFKGDIKENYKNFLKKIS